MSGKGIGRRRRVFSDEDRVRIGRMASMGIPQYQIAKVFETDGKTLRKWCRPELDLGAVIANLEVAETLFNMATSGKCAAAAIFWAKTRIRFSCSPEVPDPDAIIPAPKEARQIEAGKVTIRNWKGEPVA
jgi:hypothetical protein